MVTVPELAIGFQHRLRRAFFLPWGILEPHYRTRGNCLRVYIDGVMMVNFLVDFLLLLGTNRLAGFSSDKKRLTAAALLGAVYSGVCLLPDFRFLGNLFWRMVSLALMGVIAFGWNRTALRRCGVFLFLSLALGGLAVSIGQADFYALLLAGGGLWLLCRTAFPAVPGSQEYFSLEIRNGERTVQLLALRDTGNTLRDPVTGEQVLIISAKAAELLTGLTVQQLQHPLQTITVYPGLRLIPFRTVGQRSGMMLAMSFSDVTIDGRKTKALVAFSPENFGEKSTFQALTGGTL